MSNEINPYASPIANMDLSPGAHWVMNVSPGLLRTARGLSLIYYGIITILFGAIGGVIVAIITRVPRFFGLVLIAAGGAILIGVVLTIIGPLLCLAVPAETGAKGFLIGTVVLQGINLAHTLLGILVPDLNTRAINIIVMMLGFVSSILFVLFLKRLSEYIGRTDFVRRANNILVAGAVFIGLYALMFLGFWIGMSIVELLGIVNLIFALVLFVMYVNLIDNLRKALVGQGK